MLVGGWSGGDAAFAVTCHMLADDVGSRWWAQKIIARH